MISGGSKAKCTWRDPLAVTRGCSLRNSRWSLTMSLTSSGLDKSAYKDKTEKGWFS